MDLTPEEIKRLEGRWKSDVDLKLDRLVKFADTHEPFLALLLEREQERAEFWKAMRQHAAKVGIGSLITGGFYAMWLGIKQVLARVT